MHWHRGDVHSPKGLRAALCDIDTVFHLAAQVVVTNSPADLREDFTVNAAGTLNLFEEIRATSRQIAVVFTSTNKVFGAL
jgi:CDP-paratose 2-epimerase